MIGNTHTTNPFKNKNESPVPIFDKIQNTNHKLRCKHQSEALYVFIFQGADEANSKNEHQ